MSSIEIFQVMIYSETKDEFANEDEENLYEPEEILKKIFAMYYVFSML